jgi:single-strand DNA-binding protein
MNDLNSVFMVGRLTADSELKNANGHSLLAFRIANNYNTFDDQKKEYQEETGFYNVVLFGKQSEKIAPYLKKGNRIGVNGRLKHEEWETKEGEKRNGVKIVAYTVQFLDAPRAAASQTA